MRYKTAMHREIPVRDILAKLFRLTSALTIVCILTGPSLLFAATPEALDYSDPANWLCHPAAIRYCDTDLSTTVMAADGALTVEPFKADPEPPVDCFYLYPTASQDPAPNSDTTPGEAEEIKTVRVQFALFGSVCRLFAPLYRSRTASSVLATMTSPEDAQADFVTPMADMRAAWHHYLEHENRGRGVALIGHSQGGGMLRELVRSEIDGTAVQDRVLSAILAGTVVAVAKGSDTGGDFEQMPLCRAPGQIGCIITFTSFRSTVPPNADSGFGTLKSYLGAGFLMTGNREELEQRISGGDFQIACTNPAALAGGSGELVAYLPAGTRRNVIPGLKPQPPWAVDTPDVDTFFVSVPGLLSAKCAENEHAWYLEITVHSDPSDPRMDDVGGDVLTPEGRIDPFMGLHGLDMPATMGNLIETVRRQGETYLSRTRP